MFSMSRLTVVAKQIGIIVGALTAFCTAWVTLQFPIPMSEAAVNAKVNPIISALTRLQVSQGIIIDDLGDLKRLTLRNERIALESAISKADPSTKVTLTLRINQIQDELARINQRDKEIRNRLDNEIK